MKKLNRKLFVGKELFVFDLDGTLTASKAIADREMIELLLRLLETKRVAIIGGGKFEQFQKQFISQFRSRGKFLKNIFFFPTTSTAFYRYKGSRLHKVYEHLISTKNKTKIKKAIIDVIEKTDYPRPEKIYGEGIEDRGTQITYSVLGQDIVSVLGSRGVTMKKAWNKKYNPIRYRAIRLLQKRLPDFLVKAGGLTSIDVTPKGINKAYGIYQIEKHLNVPIEKMIFIGDDIVPGGNDYAIVRTGVDYIKVHGPEDTKRIIKIALKN